MRSSSAPDAERLVERAVTNTRFSVAPRKAARRRCSFAFEIVTCRAPRARRPEAPVSKLVATRKSFRPEIAKSLVRPFAKSRENRRSPVLSNIPGDACDTWPGLHQPPAERVAQCCIVAR